MERHRHASLHVFRWLIARRGSILQLRDPFALFMFGLVGFALHRFSLML